MQPRKRGYTVSLSKNILTGLWLRLCLAFFIRCNTSFQRIKSSKCESTLINQFLRFGTSIGANIREAFYAHGKADFIAKLQIALKECYETEYWIELLTESGYCGDEKVLNKCVELKKIMISSLNTAKENQ